MGFLNPLPLVLPVLSLIAFSLLYIVPPSSNGKEFLADLTSSYSDHKFALALFLFGTPLLLLVLLSPLPRTAPSMSSPYLISLSKPLPLPSPATLFLHLLSLLQLQLDRLRRRPSTAFPPPLPRAPVTAQQLSFFLLHGVFFLEKLREKLDRGDHGDKLWMSIGNIFAILGLFDLALFLVPVTKIPLLPAIGVPTEMGISFHRLAGSTSVILFSLHGLVHWLRFLASSPPSPAPNALSWLLLPRLSCPDPPFECDDCSCYDLNRTVTGTYALLAFLALSLSSAPHQRRARYDWFFLMHVIFAPLALAGTILHWSKSVAYIGPGLLVYAAAYALVRARYVQVAAVRHVPGYTAITLSSSFAAPGPSSWTRIAVPLPRPDAGRPLSYLRFAFSLYSKPSHP
jgi:hypothetical protein